MWAGGLGGWWLRGWGVRVGKGTSGEVVRRREIEDEDPGKYLVI